MGDSKRRVGRPSQAVLSREIIFKTALELLDVKGEKGAGMRDIAKELGVRPSALYNHVSGQDEVVAGVRELISSRIDVSGFGRVPWPEALRIWARSYRLAFATHPLTIALLAIKPLAGATRTIKMYDTVCAALIKEGVREDLVLQMIVVMESFILGSALDQVAPFDMLNPGADPEAAFFNRAYLARSKTLQGKPPAEPTFELGLEALLNSLETLAESASSNNISGESEAF